MQTTFWRNVAILDTRRVFCFILAVFAVILAILANVDQFELVSYWGARAQMPHVFSYMAMLCIANVLGYYRR